MIAFHILTAILVLLKILDIINISWWLVILPSVFPLVIVGVILLVAMVMGSFAVLGAWFFDRK